MGVQLVPIKIGDRESKKWRAVIDYDRTSEPYAIVTKNYKLVEHETVLAGIEEALSEIKHAYEYEDLNNDANSVKSGARIYRRYLFPEKEVRITPNDPVKLGLIVSNSYDTSLMFRMTLRGYTLSCSNDLHTGYEFAGCTGKHTKKLNISIPQIVSGIKRAFNKFDEQGEQWKRWHSQFTKTNDIKDLISSLIDAKVHRTEALKLLDLLPEETTTKWIAFNLLTRLQTHHMPYETARTYDKKIINAVNSLPACAMHADRKEAT